MRFLIAMFSLVALLFAPALASAHFVWVVVENDGDGKPVAHLYFSESAEPGEAHLIDRIEQTKLWSRSGDQTVPLEAKSVENDEAASLAAPLSAKAPCSVEADCLYGVFSHGDKPILLHYYAKSLDAASDLQKLGRAEKLALDIVPKITPAGLELQVMWQGKPAAGREVVIDGPTDEQTTLETDKIGLVRLDSVPQGRYAIRTHVTQPQSGTHDGEPYKEEKHYCTLTMQVPAPSASAADLLFKARTARAVWDDFPGFASDICINLDGKAHCGKMTVTAGGEVELDGVDLGDNSDVVRTLQSLITHRLSDNGFSDDVSYADDNTDHPLGRLLTLDDDTVMGSAYRVKGDTIAQVNRTMGGGRFTISVLNVRHNQEGKVLPETYNVCFWNKDGTLRSSTTVRDEWTRVGAFDLPARHMSVTAGKEVHNNVRIDFSNHQLTESAKTREENVAP